MTPQLFGDGRVPMVVRGIACAQGDFHFRHLSESCATAASPSTRSSHARFAALGHERTRDVRDLRFAISSVFRHSSASPIPPAASPSWRSSFGHETPAIPSVDALLFTVVGALSASPDASTSDRLTAVAG